MARPFEPDDDDESEVRAEGPGLVGRLLRTGVAAPNVAMSYLADQVAGWKKDFLGIFQTEIRRFLERQDPGAEIRKLLHGKRLELSIRLVDDESTPPRPAPASRAAGRPKARRKRR